MENTKNTRKKDYYKEGIEQLLEGGETIGNFRYILEEYRTVYLKKKEMVDSLFKEVKAIKKLRV